MEVSTNSVITSSTVADGCCGHAKQNGSSYQASGSQFSFSDPAYTSAQLKEKWPGNYGSFVSAQNANAHALQGNGNAAHSYSGSVSVTMNVINQTEANTEMKKKGVRFENENYKIDVSDRGEIKVKNKNTDEKYRIWGDPHVDVDGKRAFDFKGDTTFVLDDGTKITIQTTPWKGNNGQTISSEVSIIDGNSTYGVHITGVDDNHKGDLSFQEVPHFGHFLDSMVEDGNYVHENPVGKGFIAVGPDGWAEVDQSIMNFVEHTPQRLGLDLPFSGFAGSLPESALKNLLSGSALTISIEDLSSNLVQCQGCIEPGQSGASSLFETLDSMLSLIKQQARPFAQFNGLSDIQVNASYDLKLMNNPFHFSLNFARL